jgi:hypothetical protein
MGKFTMFEGFDSKLTSGVTGSLSATTNITAGNNLAAGNSLTVGNDATITDELYLPGIENTVTNNVLMYSTVTNAVSWAHKDYALAAERTVHRLNVTGNTGTNTLTINESSTPSIYDLNGANIITTNVANQDNYLRLSLYNYDPAVYGDFSCTIIHKGGATQDGWFSNADLKLQIYLPNVASIPAGTTYGVAMNGSDNAGTNYEMDQYATYTKGQLIMFDDASKWGGAQQRRMENSGIFHVFCSFSSNYIIVHGTNWESF